MKKLLLVLITLLVLCSSLYAGNTAVTATITGTDGQTWNNGTYIITFRPTPGVPGPYTVNGATFNQGPITGSLSSSGVLTVTLTDNATIQPGGSKWQFKICPNASAQCLDTFTTVTGGAQNLSATLSAAAPVISVPATPIKTAYQDSQVTTPAGIGSTYFDTTNNIPKWWNGLGFVSASTPGYIIANNKLGSTLAQKVSSACSSITSAGGIIDAAGISNLTIDVDMMANCGSNPVLLLLPAGVITCSGTIFTRGSTSTVCLIPGSNQFIQGRGIDNTILRIASGVDEGGGNWHRMIETPFTQLTIDTIANSGATRSSNVATIKTIGAHGLTVGQYINVIGVTSDTSFNTPNAIVLSTPTTTTFTYNNFGPNVGAATAGGGPVLFGITNWQITDLTLDGNKSNLINCAIGAVQGHGIAANATFNMQIHNVKFLNNCGDAIMLWGQTSGFDIRDNLIIDPQRGGTSIINASNGNIVHNYFRSIGFGSIHWEPDDGLEYGQFINVIGNTVDGCFNSSSGGISVTLHAAGDTHFNNNVIRDNTILCGNGILIQSSRNIVSGNKLYDVAIPMWIQDEGQENIVTGNLLQSGGRISGDATIAVGGIVIDCKYNSTLPLGESGSIYSDNLLNGMPGIGIFVYGTAFSGCKNITVKNNYVRNQQNVGGVQYGRCFSVLAPADNIVFTGNRCIDTQNVKTTTFGYVFGANVTNITLRDFYASGFLTAYGSDTDATDTYAPGLIEGRSFTYAEIQGAGALIHPSNGTMVYCSDCTIASPTGGGGNGAMVKMLNGTLVGN